MTVKVNVLMLNTSISVVKDVLIVQLSFCKALRRFCILILTNHLILDSHLNMDSFLVVEKERIILAGKAV